MKVYDIETLRGPDEVEGGWDNPHGMGFGSAVVYDVEDDHYTFYTNENQLINDLTDWCVLSFNGLKFDNAVLLGNSYLETPSPPWNNIDLLAQIIGAKFDIDGVPEERIIPSAVLEFGTKAVFDGSCSLDALCWHTLRKRKTGSGAHAPELIKAGNWTELWQYNLRDVRLTWQLYQFWKKYGLVIDGNDNVIRRVPLETSS